MLFQVVYFIIILKQNYTQIFNVHYTLSKFRHLAEHITCGKEGITTSLFRSSSLITQGQWRCIEEGEVTKDGWILTGCRTPIYGHSDQWCERTVICVCVCALLCKNVCQINSTYDLKPNQTLQQSHLSCKLHIFFHQKVFLFLKK